jgi:hypothetical protein
MTIKGGESGGANLVEESAVPTNVTNNDATMTMTPMTPPTTTTDQNETSDELNDQGVVAIDDGDDDDNINNSNDAFRQRKIQYWKDSDFAVGCVNVTWKDDQPSWFRCSSSDGGYVGDNGYYYNNRNANNQYAISAIVCGCLGAGRVGNMPILAQTTENYDEEVIDNETGQVVSVRNKTRPKLLWVMGPYWTANLFITFPLIIGISGWICYYRVSKSHIAIIITWSIGTFLLIISLCMISCCNPGILLRHSQPPTPNNNNNNNTDDDTEELEEDWRWNDQARTYRPSDAKFDSECQVVVEGFDHT